MSILAYSLQERRLMIMRHKKSTSSAGHDEESAQKVLKVRCRSCDCHVTVM